jgi:hypothetical protein
VGVSGVRMADLLGELVSLSFDFPMTKNEHNVIIINTWTVISRQVYIIQCIGERGDLAELHEYPLN